MPFGKPSKPTMPAQAGWVCPKCGNVYSPRTWECSECNGPKRNIIR
jgi:uncharacterized OB-fold protein